MQKSLERLEFDGVKALVARYATSSLGRSVAAEMRPYWDRDRAVRALDETAETMALIAAGSLPSTGGFNDVRPQLDRAREHGRPLEPEALADLREVLEAAHRLREHFANRDLGPRLREMTAPIGDFRDLIESIERTVDRRMMVADHASPRLKSMRERIHALSTSLRDRAERLARSGTYRTLLSESRPVLRGGRFMLPIKADFISRVPGILHGRSNSGQTAFVEPEALVEPGNELEDVKVRETREVTRILTDLTRAVLGRLGDITSTLARVAWFDFTLAKARMSVAFGMHPPVIEGRELKLNDARHPLLIEQAGAYRATPGAPPPPESPRFDVVPLTMRIDETLRMLVITGPNTGGKTVVLKTIGLLVCMAHAGVPIPARRDSRVADFTGLRVDIGDEQSLEQSLSTFSGHMKRIVDILDVADERTLVLLDELGSGTDPAEGAALARAILDALRERGAPTVVTTHLGDLKAFAYERTGVENACVEFDSETLEPTFELRLGAPGNSNALIVAERYGLPRETIDAARAALARTDRRAEDVIADLQQTRIEAERRRAASDELLEEAARVRERTEAEANQVAEKRAELQSFADEEVERQLRRVRTVLDPLMQRLKSVPKPHDEAVAQLFEGFERALTVTPLGERRERFIQKLRKNDQLTVPRLGATGRVVRIDKKRRKIGLDVGGMRVDVPFDEVLPQEDDA